MVADTRAAESGGRTVFVTGGARSGKSSYALDEAESLAGDRVFIATAEAIDEEMEDRIRRHREERSDSWVTIEEPLHLADTLRRAVAEYDVVIIDCLTLWLSNTLFSSADTRKEIDRLADAVEELRGRAHVFIVSNEVGMGIVPENELARRFRDHAGRLNRKIAVAADTAYLMVAGIPMRLK